MSVVSNALKQFPFSAYELLVACSGGVDSMVLLHALVEAKNQVTVLHVNYGLRGDDSDADEQLVRDFCQNSEIELQVIHCREQQFHGSGVNLQAEAREVRRKAFFEWIGRSENHRVVLAHHADDQVETFFLQLFRGSGTFGLGGMHEERDGIIRPFLSLSKTDLIAYALKNNVRWREDKSNASSYYLRNLFRNKLLPELKKSNTQLMESALLLMRLFRERQQELLLTVAPSVVEWTEQGTLQCAIWQSWTEEERLAFLKSVHWPVWASVRLTELTSSRVGACILVDGQRVFKVTKATLRLENSKQKNDWDFNIETIEILPKKFDKNTIYLDEEKLVGPLSFRTKKEGDRIRSVGLKGSQLVSDVMKDAGIPLTEREKTLLLTDGERILWIPGIKVSREAIADEKTLKIRAVSIVDSSH